mgnify:CR=1 FL=1
MLRRSLVAVAAVVLLTACWSPVPARADGDEISLEGEIVDLSCYLSGGKKGRVHKTCAQRCAERGLPIGILTTDNKVYLLLEDHSDEQPYEDAKKLAGVQAKIKGKQFTERGLASVVLTHVEKN